MLNCLLLRSATILSGSYKQLNIDQGLWKEGYSCKTVGCTITFIRHFFTILLILVIHQSLSTVFKFIFYSPEEKKKTYRTQQSATKTGRRMKIFYFYLLRQSKYK